MALQHKNRRGDIYHIHAKKRGDKIAYSASRKPSADSIDRLPEGYEIYERPESAQVFVRKILPTRILPTERELVESSIRRLANLEHFVVDVESASLVIYLTDANPDISLGLIRHIAPISTLHAKEMEEFIWSRARYSKAMQLTLMDDPSRQFSIDRWCIRGGREFWHRLESGRPLAQLLGKYTRHLGQDSFFDLI